MGKVLSSPYIIATDGSAKRNPGPTGWAWVGEDGRWAAGSVLEGTNNVGELLAVLYAISDHATVAELTIVADSRYAIDSYCTWIDAHERRGWTTSTGAPTKNQPILQELLAVKRDRALAGLPDVAFVHVRGHLGHRLNGWADERAGRASGHALAGLERTWSTDRGQDLVDVSVDAPQAAREKARAARRRGAALRT